MILFRCNANSHVGMGHLVRCRVLARLLQERGVQSVMTGPASSLMQTSDDDLFEAWIERPDWQNAEAEASFHLDIAGKFGARRTIMDDYRSDGAHQLLLREGGLKVLQQYDASKPQQFAAQLVVNSSPAEKREFYEGGLLADDITMLHGPRYAILRPEFLDMARAKVRGECKRLLITFGGGDDREAVLDILNAVSDDLPIGIELVLMLGRLNPNIAVIEAWLEAHPDCPVELNIDPADVPALMQSCDLALMSGGTTTFEAAYCGLPMILASIAENQYRQGEGWQALGAALYLGPFHELEPKALLAALKMLVADQQKLRNMSAIALKSVDGHGAMRILDHLLESDE